MWAILAALWSVVIAVPVGAAAWDAVFDRPWLALTVIFAVAAITQFWVALRFQWALDEYERLSR